MESDNQKVFHSEDDGKYRVTAIFVINDVWKAIIKIISNHKLIIITNKKEKIISTLSS